MPLSEEEQAEASAACQAALAREFDGLPTIDVPLTAREIRYLFELSTVQQETLKKKLQAVIDERDVRELERRHHAATNHVSLLNKLLAALKQLPVSPKEAPWTS